MEYCCYASLPGLCISRRKTMDSNGDQNAAGPRKRGGPNYAAIVGAACCLIWSVGAVRGLASEWDGFKPIGRFEARRVFRGVDATRRQMDAYIVQENSRLSQAQVMSGLFVLISSGLSFLIPWGTVTLVTRSTRGVRCPHCMSRIHRDASVCPHCQRETNSAETSEPPKD